jgi:mannose/cellobiose epimerase-like protein (N-acyl-D-glucosamine 2-epimerase family)
MSTETHIQTRDQIGGTMSPEAELRHRVRDHLKHQILGRWYPACIDQSLGGFHQEFGRDWSRRPGTTRSLVFQSRMTWVAAEAAGAFPDERDRYLAIAQHGLDGLRHHLADPKAGGFFFATDPPGTPRVAAEAKHAYGIAFAIYAAAAVSAARNSEPALDLAADTFRWLNANAWDNTHGGCHEALQRSGKPVTIGHTAPGKALPDDSIGTPIGYKSMNTHIHLLEVFTALFRVWPDPAVRGRIEELQSIITEKMWAQPGCLHTVFTADWKPVPGCDSFGHDVEAGYLLVESTQALGRPDDQNTWLRARALIDHTLAYGWDTTHGGFFDAGDATGKVRDDTKTWWVQAEGLNALCLMHHRFGKETDRYLQALRRQWSFIENHQLDPVHGGWYGYLSPDGGQVLDDGRKADEWKTAYHNGRALMNVAKLLEPDHRSEV